MLFNVANENRERLGLSFTGRLDPSQSGLEKLRRLRAVVLLAGSVRANHLRKATGRRALQMPVSEGRTVYDCWREQLTTMAEQLGVRTLPVRVMVDQASMEDTSSLAHGPLKLSVEADPLDFRGTGGLLSDIARGYDDEDLLLVGHASQLLFEPLATLIAAIASSGDDVSMVCSRDGTPSGLMLIRCGCLRAINRVGYIDLNEQAMPEIAAEHDVRIVRYERPVTRSLRTLGGYVHALRRYHRAHQAPSTVAVEDWESAFGVVEAGAQVDPSVILHDSVVLEGGRVEAGAVLVRSIVCAGAVVRARASVSDTVLGRRS
ncbi:MAG: hypothetical protein V3V20_01250 [Algisphaera sp.]